MLVGTVAAAHPAFRALTGRNKYSDFNQVWLAAYALVHGIEPYGFVARHFTWPFFYPLTAAVVGLPLTPLRLAAAATLWVGISFGLLAFALTRDAWWPLIALASLPAMQAMRFAQWTPIITAAALLPAMAWIGLAKPTTGFAVLAPYLGRIRRHGAVVLALSVLIVVASFVAEPDWVGRWRAALATSQHFRPLLLRPAGAVLLIAALRWRRPEAQMLLLLAAMPATTAPYDALPIMALIPESRMEALVLAITSYVALPILSRPLPADAHEFALGLMRDAPILVATMYVPALIMVLRRPNANSASCEKA